MQDRMRRKLLNLYIVIAGGILLVYYGIGNETWRRDSKIIISAEQQTALSNEFERTWQRPPTEDEFKQLLDVFIRRELAWREASRLELAQDDAIIRRRLQQKLEMLSADEAVRTPATREALQSYLDDHPDEFQVDPLLTFRQIHFDNTKHSIGADATARFILSKLQNQDLEEDVSRLGDPSPLPFLYTDVRGAEIALIFGQDFITRLTQAAVGEWLGPIQSTFGLHLIYVDNKIAGRVPGLDEIEGSVREQWLSARRKLAIDDLYRALAEDYTISVE